MIPVFVTLGSNLEPHRNLPWAAGLLHDQVGVVATSRVFESTPLGPNGSQLDQPGYLNAAVHVDVRQDVPPDVFKFRVLRAIEASMGRQRTEAKYAPRPIDLDIAIFGEVVDETLDIPDPEIYTRAHVALPLADLAPDYKHPVSGQTLEAIARRFTDTPGIAPVEMALLG